jgi:murein DD-endopeptidase MepM/ murein hydrolase activator NlpD
VGKTVIVSDGGICGARITDCCSIGHRTKTGEVLRKLEIQRLTPSGTRHESGQRRLWATVRRAVARAFADREVLLRANGRVRFIHLNSTAQIAGAMLMLLLVPAVLYNTARDFLFHDSVIAQNSREIDRLKSAYHALQSDTAEAQARYRLITKQLEAKHAYLLSVLQQNSTLRTNLGETRSQLQTSEEQHKAAAAAREALLAELSQLETSLKTLESEKEVLQGSLDAKETELHTARVRAHRERSRLQARSEDLQQRLASLQVGQQEVLERLSSRTADSLEQIKRLIAKTGLDPDRLLANATDSGVGGPFVEANEGGGDEARSDVQLAALNNHIDQWDELQQVLRSLPLSAPVENYVKKSPFGKRRDPINGKWAMHDGVDLAAPPKSPILSAAPGTVVFAGINGGYGRMVEIDHGMGIHTRYGHMSVISVRKGETVGMHQKLGVIGSTGRSTGRHVHYEVLVRHKPHDPMKFIEAGKHVFKG